MEEIQKKSFANNYIKIAALLFVALPGVVFLIVLLLGFDASQYDLARSPMFGITDPVVDPRNATGALLLYVTALIGLIAVSALIFMSMFVKSKKILGFKMLGIGVLTTILMVCATIIPFGSYTFAFAQDLRSGELNPQIASFMQQDILSTQARDVIADPPPGLPIPASDFAGLILAFVEIPLDQWEAQIPVVLDRKEWAPGPSRPQTQGMLTGRLIAGTEERPGGVRAGIQGAIVVATESAIATANYRFRHTMSWSVVNMSVFGMMPLAAGGLILLKNKKGNTLNSDEENPETTENKIETTEELVTE